MRRRTVSLGVLGVMALAALALGRPQQSAAKVRIGTYDNRAVAVAWAHSSFNPVGEKMRELRAAQAAGDKAKVAELEAWGPAMQRALHRQGFGRVPVDDLLECVQDRLPEAARKAGVDAIVFDCNWNAPDVEVVDVTDAVAALYDPSPETLRMIAGLKEHAPLGLDEIAKIPDDQ